MSFKLYLILLLNLILFISGYSQKLGSTITDLNSQKQLHDYHNISCCEINEKGKNEKFNRSLIGSITHIEVENNSPLLLVEGQNPEITYQITVISALKDVSRVEIKSLNCLGSTISLVDNGSNNDAAANDNIYTGTGLVCNQLPTIAQDEILDIGYLPHNERIELSITFTDGTEEEYIFRKNIFIIPQKFEEEIIASSSISQLNDSVQYASNVINWVAPKQLNCNRPDYDTKQIRLEFESIWSEFPSPNVVVFSPNDVNEGKYLVDGSFDGSRMTLFRIDPVIINHELNHKWVRSALNYNLPSNSGHWGFIQRNSSGFGKACYNGVFDSLYLNGTSVNYDIQFPPDGLWDDYNDIELYLMGLISIDEISFPITYVDNGQCSFGGNFNGGELKYYNKSDLQSYIEEYPAVRTLVIKDSLVLPIIIVTEKKLNETELLMYNRFAIDYESYFKERTQDLGVLSTKIYKLPVDEDNDGYDIAEDCDDNNPDINPGQTEEPYNGIDDDCNSATFDDDLDQDGFLMVDDCDDNNSNISPDQTEEPYNGIDDDCNSATLDDDLDQDGFLLADDCDDNNSNINPNQTEDPYNGIDDDCNPVTLDDDLDQDGFLLADDCNDNNSNINPNQTENPYNGIDDDCNSATLDDDLDQDGFVLADDCDDDNSAINPDVVDIPNNGIDEDCDGMDLLSSTHEIANTILNIYPNPAIDLINIDVEGQLNFNVNIYELNGRLIKTFINKSQISMNSIPTGTYLLEIQDLNSTQKIVERIVIGK